jgi:dipeptidyl-peptidase-4
MSKKALTLLIPILSGIFSYSQKNFTIEEATSGQYQKFAPQTMAFAQWRGKAHEFTYLVDYEILMRANEKSGWTGVEFTNLSKFKEALKTFAANTDINADKVAYFPYQYEWINDSIILVDAVGSKFNYSLSYDPFRNKVDQVMVYDMEAEQVFMSPERKGMAYTIGNNLYYSSNKGTNIFSITSDEDKGIVNGSDYVHRQEFGIDRGIFYSPKGNYIAYYRKDETMVAQYPLVNTSTRIATENMIRYPMAGEKGEEVTLVVFNTNTQQQLTIKTTGPAEQYLTSITWDPTEKYIYIGVLNREQNHLQLNKYDVVTGNFVQTLFEEKHPKYVEPLHPLTFMKTKPNQFIFQSQRDGYNHLYLYDTSGKLIKQLTKGEWIVTDLIGFDSKEENVYFTSNYEEVIGRQLCSVNIKNGKLTRITKTPGMHNGQLSKDGAFWIDYNNSTTVLNNVSMIQTKTGKTTQLLASKNTYEGINMPTLEMVTITSADGKTPLYGRLVTPPNMDKTKKYPVVVYVYGGPHAQMVNNEWLGGATLFEYYMAQQGFIMFTMDNRGSEGRGFEFESVIHRQLGQNEMADQLKGVDYLKTLPYVDANKMGVYGWSFGGFMTISLMLNHSDVFKVAVAGGPVCDWKYYEIMYGERYMDTPQENPDGYDKTSVVNKADKLKGRLLIIHGAQDDVVVMQHSMQFINACIKKGKKVDYFLYPDHKHNVRGPDRVHLNTKIWDYFETHLK